MRNIIAGRVRYFSFVDIVWVEMKLAQTPRQIHKVSSKPRGCAVRQFNRRKGALHVFRH